MPRCAVWAAEVPPAPIRRKILCGHRPLCPCLADVTEGPKHRLAGWILEFQSFDFDAEHAPGNRSIMVIRDALSRETTNKGLTLCARCLETESSVEEELTQVDVLRCADLRVQRVTERQWKEFEDVKDMVG
jgi:hypothetical protein